MPCTALQQICIKLILSHLSNLNLERVDYASRFFRLLCTTNEKKKKSCNKEPSITQRLSISNSIMAKTYIL